MTLALELRAIWSRSSSALRKGSSQEDMKTRPWRFMTAYFVPLPQLALVDAEAGGADGVVGGAEDAAAADVGVGRDRHVLEDLFLVPDVVAGGDDVRAEVEELFGDGGRDAEAAGGVFAVDDEEVDGVGFEDVGKVLADDVAAGRAEDVADEENVHLMSLSRMLRKAVERRSYASG